MRDKQKRHVAQMKTYYFLLLIENKKLTKVVSLTGNNLETSGLLYSAMFCINQKNASLICKSSVFLPHCPKVVFFSLTAKTIPLKNEEITLHQHNNPISNRKISVRCKELLRYSLPILNHKCIWHYFHQCCNQDS